MTSFNTTLQDGEKLTLEYNTMFSDEKSHWSIVIQKRGEELFYAVWSGMNLVANGKGKVVDDCFTRGYNDYKEYKKTGNTFKRFPYLIIV